MKVLIFFLCSLLGCSSASVEKSSKEVVYKGAMLAILVSSPVSVELEGKYSVFVGGNIFSPAGESVEITSLTYKDRGDLWNIRVKRPRYWELVRGSDSKNVWISRTNGNMFYYCYSEPVDNSLGLPDYSRGCDGKYWVRAEK